MKRNEKNYLSQPVSSFPQKENPFQKNIRNRCNIPTARTFLRKIDPLVEKIKEKIRKEAAGGVKSTAGSPPDEEIKNCTTIVPWDCAKQEEQKNGSKQEFKQSKWKSKQDSAWGKS